LRSQSCTQLLTIPKDLTDEHRRWLDIPLNYGAFAAAMYYNMVDVVMPGLCSSCVKSCPLPLDLMIDNEDEIKSKMDCYKQVQHFFSPLTFHSLLSPGNGNLSPVEGVAK